MPRTKPIAMHTPAAIVRFRVTAAAPPPVSRAAPSASRSAPTAPTIKPTSPMRLAVPAAKAAISPMNGRVAPSLTSARDILRLGIVATATDRSTLGTDEPFPYRISPQALLPF